MNITIYHNPRCSKSRKTLELLEQTGEPLTVVEYLDSPPNHARLREILSLLECEPREIMRTKEKPYADLDLANPALSRDELIAAMVENPILIERPIVVANGKAVIGRPPENIAVLFDD